MVVSGSVKIGGTAVASTKAALEISSTTKGILLPRMTATQRDAISSVPEGLVLYDTVAHEMNIYNGSGWKAIFDAANISGVLSGSVLPAPGLASLGGVFSHAAVSNNFLTAVLTDGTITNAQPSFSNISGTLAIGAGGTGQTAKQAAFDALSPLTTAGDIVVYASGHNDRLAAGTAGKPLISGAGVVPNTYDTLTVAGGGTGAVTLTNHGVVLGQGTSAVAITSAGTAGQYLKSNGASADPTFASFTGPTISKLTSGTGATYTPPATAVWLRVRMVGGGGGGQGTGTGGVTTGGTVATATTFGALTAGAGGNTGVAGGGTGGSVFNNAGGSGQLFQSSFGGPGQAGGLSAFGGNGAPGSNAPGAGGAAAVNSGSGGGTAGAGAANVGQAISGGAGGYVEHIYTTIAASYTYTIGVAGTGGSQGTAGQAGGSGGTGLIIVEEHYH